MAGDGERGREGSTVGCLVAWDWLSNPLLSTYLDASLWHSRALLHNDSASGSNNSIRKESGDAAHEGAFDKY